MLLNLLLLATGLVLLVVGADGLVRGAVSLARMAGISPLVIGLTVVALGTSLPELLVSLDSAASGSVDLAVGNVVGSNIANSLLILGVAALASPIASPRTVVARDGAVMALATLCFVALAQLGAIGRWHGGIGLATLVAYLGWSYLSERAAGNGRHAADAAGIAGLSRQVWQPIAAVVIGLIALLLGADLLVRAALTLARLAGVSEGLIGLTLVAFGTSLPELATILAATYRRQPSVALGNILGSNIFNLLGVLSSVALLTPFTVPPAMLAVDLWLLLGVTALLILFMLTERRVGRTEGGILLASYGLFIAHQFI